MRITAVIPTYNSASLLGRSVGSVLAQTSPVDEVIVVDDGSTDATRDVVAAFDGPVRYVRQEHAGVSAARNAGIREAGCEWIAFLDADDEWFPHKIARQRDILARHPSLHWCACAPVLVVNRNGRREEVSRLKENVPGRPSVVRYFRDALDLNFGTGCYVIRRSALDEAGPFDTSLRRGEDRDVWWRIAMRHPMIGFCWEVCWRIHVDTPNSLSKSGDDGQGQLAMLCRNLQLAQSLGPRAFGRFYPFARMHALDYLYRAAGRHASISAEQIDEARRLFPPLPRQRMLIGLLAALPKPVARKVLNRVTL
jgi:glycosyltransferase involved in cell wall biosynthesis